MSIWDTPVGELPGTWFILGVVVTLLVVSATHIVKEWMRDD